MPLSRLIFRIGIALANFALSHALAHADTVNVTWNLPTDIPVTAAGYTASGNSVNLTLNCVPTANELMVVKNTGPAFIQGACSNLAQGQALALTHAGVTYDFVAHYYGGTGNDLVLVWAGTRAFAWGANTYGQLGDNSKTRRLTPGINAHEQPSHPERKRLTGSSWISAAPGTSPRSDPGDAGSGIPGAFVNPNREMAHKRTTDELAVAGALEAAARVSAQEVAAGNSNYSR